MPSYVILCQYTDEGARTIKQAPERRRANIERAQAAGIKIVASYTTLGEYDQVIIAEAPSEEVAVTGILGLAQQGILRTKTLRAFSNEEIDQLISRLPG
jgi:uncharacterized protein with GYD domain